MQTTMIPGVSMWSQWQPDRNVFFNSHFVESPAGNLLVDPLALDESDERAIDERGGAAWIVMTNRDHERASKAASERFGAKIAATAPEAALLSVKVDRELRSGDEICNARVIALDGMKSPLELALWFRETRTILVGDALWGSPAGSLSLPPRVGDAKVAILSLRALRARKPKHVLVGDGMPIFERGYEALNEFLERRTEAFAGRLNMDELVYGPIDESDPPEYRSQSAEIGYVVGATVMGYQSARLSPGTSVCPTHWHTVDEELFVVWEGSPLLRTPQGETRLRRGDVVCFPANERGAHKLINDTEEHCVVLMVASNEKPDDACFYPDSDKLLVSAKSLIVRASPALDYYDGER